ncbi:MAG: efflux RND transporter periplasmic adaptor subunit [Gemmatimonadetes bacterium]|nr:efflux RND transporter periplasmic adaptor subunit [Gemmatimonadota bacterium]
MTRRRKAWIGAVVLALLVAVLGVGFAKRRNAGSVEVETEVLRKRDLVAIVSASGEIQPQRSVDVHANSNGRIVRLAVREGQAVTRGDFLLQIDPVTAQSASEAQSAVVRAAERDTEALRAELEQSRRELGRVRELADKDLISQEELQRSQTTVERVQAQLSAALARVDQARAGLRGSRYELSQVTVSAPMSGIVTRLNVEEGEFAFSTGLSPTLLLTIADLAVMEAEVKVDETDVVNVKVGQPADVTVDAFPDTTFHGSVSEVGTSPILVEGKTPEDARDFKVVVTLHEALPVAREGLSATADVETARTPGAVALPIQSLVVREVPRPKLREAPPDTLEGGEETEGVFVVRAGVARFVAVDVGITGDRFFQVRGGVAPGDTVVSGSYEALRDLDDGDRVRITTPPGDERDRRRREGRASQSGDDGEGADGRDSRDDAQGSATAGDDPEANPRA